MRTGPKASYAAPAVEKAFEVLELFASRPDGALISEMAVQLGRSVGEIFRIVIVMEKMGILRKSHKDDRYSVAYKFLDLAYRVTHAKDLVETAKPAMRQLALDTAQSCHLVVINDSAGMVIAREQNPGTRGFSLRLGAAVDILNSCSGQVLLAFSPEELRDHVIEQASRLTPQPPSRATLDKRFVAIHRRGHEQRKSPITRGVTDISYPVFGPDGMAAGALTIPFLELIDGSQRVDMETARQMLDRAAQEISISLGHTPRP
ncbi:MULTISPECIES: IclR family transcriptional regulator [unclassified Novosphingobium]|uniref:IclR family transcriptional regulator n=1 Tax=Novosphingobium TaxID=165696 RepID=UPI0017A15437|nr:MULTISPECIES: IclR family transcriptional regulator [unclassified Novosphingobium]NMN04627.1 DNA-binding IclR family transcriptional regulator [Novosphingobium sp. SG919]NMN85380.1 DNA-binding IclR family transcriptional regulator [Novosphingobium sp. SG916]